MNRLLMTFVYLLFLLAMPSSVYGVVTCASIFQDEHNKPILETRLKKIAIVKRFTGVVEFDGLKATLIENNNGLVNLKTASKLEDVVNLADNQKISLEIYNDHRNEDIARSIVDRIRKQEKTFKKQFEGDPSVDLKNESDMIIFFPPEDFMAIKNHGFKNQHQAQKSNGTYLPELRVEVEDNFTGIKLGNNYQSQSLRPKSAFLNIRAHSDLATKDGPEIRRYGYGRTGAVLKNSLKDRSIWTLDDSATLGKQIGETTGEILSRYRGTFDRGSISISKDLGKDDTVPSQWKIDYDRYYEALIYGDVRIDDVECSSVS